MRTWGGEGRLQSLARAHWLLSPLSLKEPAARLEALQEVCRRLPRENLSNLR